MLGFEICCICTYISIYYACSYGMLASVSCVLREAMAAHLNAIVGRMIESLVSDEGLTVSVALYSSFPPPI